MYYKEPEQTTVVKNCGIGFMGLLQIAFIVLKLCGVITWKWVFVLMPLIVEAGLVAVILILALIACIIAAIVDR